MQVEETTQSTPLRPTRAGFVRGLPLSMPVEEVIERGREAGIELQPSDIHAARYYMRQAAAADSADIPQQLLLGGTFVTKPVGRANGPARVSPNGQSSSNGAAQAKSEDRLGKLDFGELRDADDQDDESDSKQAAAPRRRKIVQRAAPPQEEIKEIKEVKLAKAPKEPKASKASVEKGAGLHGRLQARLSNATFRETAREGREASRGRSEKQDRAERAERAERAAERAERAERAMIGKALLDLDAIKPRGKRAASVEALEEQVRLIALRLGTQRVRELLDEMEELARRA